MGKIRRFIVTVEEVDPQAIEHQQVEPIQTRQPGGPVRLPDEEWSAWSERRVAETKKAERKQREQTRSG